MYRLIDKDSAAFFGYTALPVADLIIIIVSFPGNKSPATYHGTDLTVGYKLFHGPYGFVVTVLKTESEPSGIFCIRFLQFRKLLHGDGTGFLHKHSFTVI